MELCFLDALVASQHFPARIISWVDWWVNKKLNETLNFVGRFDSSKDKNAVYTMVSSYRELGCLDWISLCLKQNPVSLGLYCIRN